MFFFVCFVVFIVCLCVFSCVFVVRFCVSSVVLRCCCLSLRVVLVVRVSAFSIGVRWKPKIQLMLKKRGKCKSLVLYLWFNIALTFVFLFFVALLLIHWFWQLRCFSHLVYSVCCCCFFASVFNGLCVDCFLSRFLDYMLVASLALLLDPAKGQDGKP